MESKDKQVNKVTKLKLLLIKKDVSQTWLSEKSGVEKAQISNIAAGKQKNLMMDTAVKLCKALDVTLDELFWD